MNVVRVTMLQASPHVTHFISALNFGDGQVISMNAVNWLIFAALLAYLYLLEKTVAKPSAISNPVTVSKGWL